jgi:hypothetical protein
MISLLQLASSRASLTCVKPSFIAASCHSAQANQFSVPNPNMTFPNRKMEIRNILHVTQVARKTFCTWWYFDYDQLALHYYLPLTSPQSPSRTIPTSSSTSTKKETSLQNLDNSRCTNIMANIMAHDWYFCASPTSVPRPRLDKPLTRIPSVTSVLPSVLQHTRHEADRSTQTSRRPSAFQNLEISRNPIRALERELKLETRGLYLCCEES